MPVEENLREDELVRAKLAQEINRFDGNYLKIDCGNRFCLIYAK